MTKLLFVEVSIQVVTNKDQQTLKIAMPPTDGNIATFALYVAKQIREFVEEMCS